MKNKWKKRKNNNRLKTIIILAALIVIVAIVSALFIRGKYSHTLEFDCYQIVCGIEVPIEEGARITVQDELIECSNGNSVDRVPVYSHKKKNYALLVPAFSVVQPYEAQAPRRLLPFTEITKEQDKYIMKRGKNTAFLERCFMYDCKDTYFFTRDIQVTIGSDTIALTPFSYVYAPYNQPGYAYDYASGTITDIPQGASVSAQFDNNYVIYLDTDRMESKDSGIILHQNVEDLERYK